ncbi:MAG: protein-L-isoaspartate O-methyltransferase family protein [Thermaurantiacus sp.]
MSVDRSRSFDESGLAAARHFDEMALVPHPFSCLCGFAQAQAVEPQILAPIRSGCRLRVRPAVTGNCRPGAGPLGGRLAALYRARMTLPLPPSRDRRTEAARLAMIESQLMPCGVVEPRLVAAFVAVPRERFVLPARRALAYVDAAQPLGEGRAMMPPLSLGILLQALQPFGGERALVVGAGTGYSAALLRHMGLDVTALEESPSLAAAARAELGADARVVEGPLVDGWPVDPPHDLMLIDGAVEVLPDALAAQVRDGGRIATVISGDDGVERATLVRRVAEIFHQEPLAECSAPLLPGFARAARFAFA